MVPIEGSFKVIKDKKALKKWKGRKASKEGDWQSEEADVEVCVSFLL